MGTLLLSPLRKQGSITLRKSWIPACAGMTREPLLDASPFCWMLLVRACPGDPDNQPVSHVRSGPGQMGNCRLGLAPPLPLNVDGGLGWTRIETADARGCTPIKARTGNSPSSPMAFIGVHLRFHVLPGNAHPLGRPSRHPRPHQNRRIRMGNRQAFIAAAHFNADPEIRTNMLRLRNI